MSSERRRSYRPLIRVLVVALISFISLRMFSVPTDYDVVKTLILPKFPDLEESLNDEETTEKIAVAVDGQIAFKNSDDAQPTASTAKMLLALMVMEKKPFSPGNAGGTIEITQEFYDLYSYYVSHGGSYTRVTIGEEISEYDAIASALIASSNNMADSLAIWAFGSLDNYKTYAENHLKEWGIKNTVIGSDASGFSDTTTSTASDLALIGQKLMGNPVLAEIVGQESLDVPIAGEIENTNELLGEQRIIGIKTGYIGDTSGYCLVSAYKEADHLITVTVLGAETREASFEKTSSIIETLQSELKEVEIAAADREIGYYESWWADRTPIIARNDMKLLAWDSATISSSLDMPKPESSDVYGDLKVTVGSNEESFEAFAKDLVPKPSFLDRLLHAFFLK